LLLSGSESFGSLIFNCDVDLFPYFRSLPLCFFKHPGGFFLRFYDNFDCFQAGHKMLTVSGKSHRIVRSLRKTFAIVSRNVIYVNNFPRRLPERRSPLDLTTSILLFTLPIFAILMPLIQGLGNRMHKRLLVAYWS